jgi:molybdate/tungstate transport system ATP-binding protein
MAGAWANVIGATCSRAYRSVPCTLTWGGSLRLRYEHTGNFNIQRYADDRGSKYASGDFLLHRERLDLNLGFTETTRLFVQLQNNDVFNSDFKDKDFFQGQPFTDPLDLRQAYLEWLRILDTPFGFRIGRQAIFFADNRLWGPAESGNTGRYTWDAAKLIADLPLAETQLIFANRITYEPHGFDEHDTHLDAYGLYSVVKGLPFTLNLFWIGKHTLRVRRPLAGQLAMARILDGDRARGKAGADCRLHSCLGAGDGGVRRRAALLRHVRRASALALLFAHTGPPDAPGRHPARGDVERDRVRERRVRLRDRLCARADQCERSLQYPPHRGKRLRLVIQIENLSVDLGAFHLREISLTIEDGEYMVLLGPTGAGKTVLVECLVGIHRPKAGRILIDGQDVTVLYPEERNVGYVPQDYALFPNMTVAENLAYGLKARRRPKAEIGETVEGMMDLLGIGHLRHRLPLNLSGGEKQRCALGRALVTKPCILLLDEPLAALDENFRSELAAEIRHIQRTLGGTFLHVCHSLEETTDVADRVALLHEGRLVQVGSIEQLLSRPADLFVAQFTRSRNLLDGFAERTSSGCEIRLANGLSIDSDRDNMEGPVTVAIRPEDIEILRDGTPAPSSECLRAAVVEVRERPTHTEIEFDAGITLVAYVRRASHGPRVGEIVFIRVLPRAVKVFRQH